MNVMRGMRYFFIMFLFPLFTSSQNLLMNEGFEDENICSEYEKNCAPEGWISTSLTADYYFDDKANAFRGRHFIGLQHTHKSGGPNTASVIRSRLLCSLRKGKIYQLSFYIRSKHTLDSLAIYFSRDDILLRRAGIKEIPQLWIRDGMEEFRPGSWQKINLRYEASGEEQYINIGDFRKNEYSFRAQPDLGTAYYYFLDEVSLLAADASEFICDNAVLAKEEAYDFNPRHKVLDRWRYSYRNEPPPLTPLKPTVISRIDTLVIPDVLFAVNSFELGADAHRVLDSFSAKFSTLQIDSLVVEGHTDSTGTIQLNQVLSVNRALSVGRYLQPFVRTAIIARGWASQKPVADNRTSPGRQKNRRVEIYLYTRE